jgi:hypothetical protein
MCRGIHYTRAAAIAHRRPDPSSRAPPVRLPDTRADRATHGSAGVGTVRRRRLRGDDAYTPEELARLNARRTSTAEFAPYDDPPRPAP